MEASAYDYRSIMAGDEQYETEVYGINMHYLDLYGHMAAEGELLKPIDFIAGTRKAVLSSQLAESLFPYESAVGQTIKVGAYPIDIVAS